jgi:hypothetical protein
MFPFGHLPLIALRKLFTFQFVSFSPFAEELLLCCLFPCIFPERKKIVMLCPVPGASVSRAISRARAALELFSLVFKVRRP